MTHSSKTYIWSHEPFLSGEPHKRLRHSLLEGQEGEIDEVAVFELSNGKFLFIRFYGNNANLEEGVTDLDEFDSELEAVEIYESLFDSKLNG